MTAGTFSVQWTPTAQRDLRRLPEKIGTAVVEFVYGSLAKNPDASVGPFIWSSPAFTPLAAASIA